MAEPVRKHIVVSAVNIRRGGTLTVLRDCLQYLSSCPDYAVTALVHKQELCDFPGIRYIEIPWSIQGWGRRLWCEYVTMNRISKQLPAADLWLSLHDTTPRVRAKRQAVYCHTSFPFLKVHGRDWLMNPKIPLFATFTKYAYRIGVRRNAWLIVQQEWFRKGLSQLTNFPEGRIIVAPPKFQPLEIPGQAGNDGVGQAGNDSVGQAGNDGVGQAGNDGKVLFFYPSGPDCHKNFETLCRAAAALEQQIGKGRFKVIITVKGDENRYAQWLKKNWGSVDSIDFQGYVDREKLAALYGQADCLVFPSRVETWGLPISEFKPTGKPMILADLPYAHESAAGSKQVAFYAVEDFQQLSSLMLQIIQRNFTNFARLLPSEPHAPHAADWTKLFETLLSDENSATR